jgi:hypothetical protein
MFDVTVTFDVMGLPGRWQTRHPNAEPNRWFLCRKPQRSET